MSKHAIIIIKNKNNEYLQYYDERWNTKLFLNTKITDLTTCDDIKNVIKDKLGLKTDDFSVTFLKEIVHTKYSVSALKMKEYEHSFYLVCFKEYPLFMNEKNFNLAGVSYFWNSYNELLNDERVMETNSDIVSFVKELEEEFKF